MTHHIELPWEEFKTQCLSGSQWSCIYFDHGQQYKLFAKQNSFTVLCKMQKDDGADQVDFETNYKDSITNTFVDNTQTQFERTDIVLKCAKDSAEFSSGEAEISIKVPGTVGSGDGRYVAGGYAFTDLFTYGDKMKSISIVDVDNILGYGAHTVIQTYHDADVDDVNQGWYMWPHHSVSGVAGGEIEIDPLGYYGFIPSGLYLEIYFECSAATNVYCDIWWGQSVE